MQRTLRTFVAIEIPDDVRRRAVDLIGRLSRAQAQVKWVEAHNLHMTLKFLGDVPHNELPDVCRSLAESATLLDPFEIELAGAGAFPHASRPRTLWLGVSTGADTMVDLHDAIEASLAELGFRTEGRRFQPHLTIGRVRHGPQGIRELAQHVEKASNFVAGSFRVEEVVLFSSQLGDDGPAYEVLARAPLGMR